MARWPPLFAVQPFSRARRQGSAHSRSVVRKRAESRRGRNLLSESSVGLLLASLLVLRPYSAFAVLIDSSQVPPLLEMQAGWGVSLSEWRADGNCDVATGLVCDEGGFVTSMTLTSQQVPSGLPGPFPTAIGSLTHLTELALDLSTGGAASIPDSISSLRRLAALHLSGAALAGSMPSAIAQLTALASLSLLDSNMTGSVPAFLSALTQLTELALYNGAFTGVIPDTIASLTALQRLMLAHNNFTGSIPNSLSALSSLEYL
ncbi:hypothetical protein CLOP_g2661 [Closterium sp. NIES-67]|nr:hypothetical protein CLOP_g2661 [Closterium sp. NIES-67]